MRIQALALVTAFLLGACAPEGRTPAEADLYVYRFDPPAFLRLNDDLREDKEIPFEPPGGCSLAGVFAAPRGPRLAVELSCSFGPAVVWLDVDTGSVEQPITTADSHFLAWAPSGDAAYLKIDSINQPRVVRVGRTGAPEELAVSELTYDLAPAPDGRTFLFAFSRGMGLGSEMWSAAADNGAIQSEVLVDPENYLSLARWSPDGGRAAFIRIPDSSTPFRVGELWAMGADGDEARRLSSADAGHGFAPAWSPDGRAIAFVRRENAEDPRADTSTALLVSNLYLAHVDTGEVTRLSDIQTARVEAPVWHPVEDTLAFTVTADDRMTVFLKNLETSEMVEVPFSPACCAVWVRR